jgi:putative redox protein
MKERNFTFKNTQGYSLSARIEWPANQQPHSYAIFAHCFTCGKSLNAARNISKALAGRGFAVLSFDFTGIGKSEGEFADTNFSANVNDLLAAADFLEKEFEGPALLVGHSLGGAAVLLAATQISSVKAVATIGAPADVEHVKHIFKERLPEIEARGIAQVDIGGSMFTVKKQFVDDLESHTLTKSLAELRKSLLILHSPQDDTVSVDNAALLYQAARHPKSFVSLDGGDHLLTNKNDSYYAGEVIATWAQRYIEIPDESPMERLESEHQTVAVVGDRDSGYTTLIKTGKHFITADEPEDIGGNDFGPTPYQLLISALATCTAMTLRMYANRKQMELAEIKVHVNHSKRHCEDCASDDPNSRIDHFERLIEIEGELSAEQRRRLLEIADKCPVHRTLEGSIAIQTRYVT